MAIDTLSALVNAVASYNKVSNQNINNTVGSVKDSVDFHKMVNVEFNRFATMTPNQILSHITDIKAQRGDAVNFGIVESVFGETKRKLLAQEEITSKSLVNEASLVDLVTTTTEAKNTLKTMVAVRNKLVESFEKILSMQM